VAVAKFFFGPTEKINERRAVQPVAHIEVGQACNLRVLVPRTTSWQSSQP